MTSLRAQCRRAALCVTASILAFSAVTFPTAAENNTPSPGDCNNNGDITIEDVYLLRDYLATGTALTQPSAADLNEDSRIDAADLTLLKRMLLYPEDTVESTTVMIYLCGSDLETQAEQATLDMYEIMEATDSEALNVVMVTGGSSDWSSENPYVDEKSNYYVTCTADGVDTVPCENGSANMAESDTLTTFIQYAVETCPADRYALIMWDHGGGPVYGLCYDEVYDQSMSIETLCEGLDNASVTFDWIGFDCCLMGCAEIAYAMRGYADYMIASEESESGLGWSYTRFLSALSETPDMDTQELAQIIISDMISDNRRYQMEATLALYDLSQAEAVMNSLYTYVDDIYAMYQEEGISTIMNARAQAQDFGEGEYDLVDLVHLASLLPTEHSDELVAAIDAMVLEEKTYRMDNANGVAAWFFENYPNEAIYLDYTMRYYDIDRDYIEKLQTMATAAQSANAAGIPNTAPEQDDIIITAFQRRFEAMQ